MINVSQSEEDVPVQGIVFRSGFLSYKGQIIRAMIFPKPIDERFFNHFLKLSGILTVLAFIELACFIPQMEKLNLMYFYRFLKLGEAILSGCPPGVFIFWNLAITESMRRLKG